MNTTNVSTPAQPAHMAQSATAPPATAPPATNAPTPNNQPNTANSANSANSVNSLLQNANNIKEVLSNTIVTVDNLLAVVQSMQSMQAYGGVYPNHYNTPQFVEGNLRNALQNCIINLQTKLAQCPELTPAPTSKSSSQSKAVSVAKKGHKKAAKSSEPYSYKGPPPRISMICTLFKSIVQHIQIEEGITLLYKGSATKNTGASIYVHYKTPILAWCRKVGISRDHGKEMGKVAYRTFLTSATLRGQFQKDLPLVYAKLRVCDGSLNSGTDEEVQEKCNQALAAAIATDPPDALAAIDKTVLDESATPSATPLAALSTTTNSAAAALEAAFDEPSEPSPTTSSPPVITALSATMSQPANPTPVTAATTSDTMDTTEGTPEGTTEGEKEENKEGEEDEEATQMMSTTEHDASDTDTTDSDSDDDDDNNELTLSETELLMDIEKHGGVV